MSIKRNTIKTIISKKGKNNITALTSYSYQLSKIMDQHCDIILVGDSLGMVLYGMESTLSVDLNMMINHGKAVVKGSKKALVVIDMPFASYQESPQKAFKNAAKIISKTNAQAVKLEGGIEMAETIKFLTERGIAVLAHIGLKPQSFNLTGGFVKQGKTDLEIENLKKDIIAVEKAGAFATVLEAVDEKATAEVMKLAKLPIIGIGSGKNCDGQILVTDDLIGLTENPPAFINNDGKIKELIESKIKDFCKK
jgi:3-methyl-2-oxobutanoate hydroxymethyltransferase